MQIKERIGQFTLPNSLDFRYPPTTPTAMYPGPGFNMAWDEGPAGLLGGSRSNATLLLQVSYMESIERQLSSTNTELKLSEQSRDDILAEIASKVAALEDCRESCWSRLQNATPDPCSLRNKVKRYDAGNITVCVSL